MRRGKLTIGGAAGVIGGAALLVVGATVALACEDSVSTSVKDVSTSAAWAGTESTGASAYDVATVSWSNTDNTTYGPLKGTVTFKFSTGSTCSSDHVVATWPQTGVALTTPVEADSVWTATATSKDTTALTPGSYSFLAEVVATANSKGFTYSYAEDGAPVCEPFTVKQNDPPTATTVKDAATSTTWAGTETAGAKAYDTTTVTTPEGAPVATGTVTYTFYNDGTCGSDNVVWTEDPVTLVDGAVPNSETTAALAAGSYSFSATYNGDSNYKVQAGACEPFTVSVTPPTPSTLSTPTPTGSVQGVTTPGTGSGPTSGLSLLGLALLCVGGCALVAQAVIRRRMRHGTIEDI